ncbi:MAG: hypothetical protein ACK5MA_04435 [Parachlamydiaceae bacterium]
MPSIRDIVVFFAGFQTFHTLSHLLIAFTINLPLQTKYMTLTSTMNTWAIFVNGIITLVLFWLAKILRK